MVKWCTGLSAAWTRLWTCRLRSELYHCQFCVSWCHSHVSPESLFVPQRFNIVVSLSWTGPNLAFCTNSSFSFNVQVVTTSSDEEIATMSDHVLISTTQYLHQLSEQSVAILLLQGACRDCFTYVSVSTSACKNVRLAVEYRRSCQSLRV